MLKSQLSYLTSHFCWLNSHLCWITFIFLCKCPMNCWSQGSHAFCGLLGHLHFLLEALYHGLWLFDLSLDLGFGFLRMRFYGFDVSQAFWGKYGGDLNLPRRLWGTYGDDLNFMRKTGEDCTSSLSQRATILMNFFRAPCDRGPQTHFSGIKWYPMTVSLKSGLGMVYLDLNRKNWGKD